MKKREILIEFLVPTVAVVLFGLLSVFGAFDQFDLKVRDLTNNLVPVPKEDPSITLIDIDERAYQNVGTWPWSRDIHARLLLKLRELGLDYITFDIEFLDKSLRGTNDKDREVLQRLKSEEMQGIFAAIDAGQISAVEAAGYADTVLGDSMAVAARDNDDFLGKAMRLFGNSFATLNFEIEVNDNAAALEAQAYTIEHIALEDVRGDISLIPESRTIRPAIIAVLKGSTGAGFTNIDPDSDGTFRRVSLLHRVGDKVFAQLAFEPLLSKLGNPPIEVQPGKIIIKTSEVAANPSPDIVVPYDGNGFTYINWPHKTYKDSFKHASVADVQTLQNLEDDVEDIVKKMGANRYLTAYFGEDFSDQLDKARTEVESLLTGDISTLSPESLDNYYAIRASYFEKVERLVKGDTQSRLLAEIDASSSDPQASDQDKADAAIIREGVVENFDNLAKVYDNLVSIREKLESVLKGGFAIIGQTATGTTDIGVNPFDSQYMNPGTHAAVANTVLTRNFMTDMPKWSTILAGVLFSFGVAIIVWRLKTIAAVLSGFAVFIGVIVIGIVVFVVSNSYPGLVMPALSVFFTVISLTVYKFVGTEREKRYIRGAFQAYLSPEVISELEADPNKLQLGGQKRRMTAMFTDVKGFSTFSEKLDPNDLVKLLNEYLTAMSDVILDTRGTIDKYEGDAIIAFWGAPTVQPDNALRAVQSAVRMRRIEKELNDRLVADGTAPSPLFTRFGINTGDMTVGNMGTPRRMNYTIMGNSVNLAARLEGVNKEYGTWILTSEATRGEIDDGFLFRKLDRVRVVGIKTPVRLYEVVEEKSFADNAMFDAVKVFEEGIDLFEAQQWDKAMKAFQETMKLHPDDGPAIKFMDRVNAYKKSPPPENWDGVFSLTSK